MEGTKVLPLAFAGLLGLAVLVALLWPGTRFKTEQIVSPDELVAAIEDGRVYKVRIQNHWVLGETPDLLMRVPTDQHVIYREAAEAHGVPVAEGFKLGRFLLGVGLLGFGGLTVLRATRKRGPPE